MGELGKGVYGNVVKAEDLTSGKEYAIKILRSADLLTKSGEREAAIINKLNETDPFDKKHVIRMGGTFIHKKHLCFVLELLNMNLRDAIRFYGRRVGLSLPAVRSYSYQIFKALSHLKKNRIVHADIKPDNILINKSNETCKLTDFGNAVYVDD